MKKNINPKPSMLAKTKQQIAAEYNIHRNTLCRKLKALGLELPRGLLYPEQVKKIYDALGHPRGGGQENQNEQ